VGAAAPRRDAPRGRRVGLPADHLGGARPGLALAALPRDSGGLPAAPAGGL